jgi:hypothetical protein
MLGLKNPVQLVLDGASNIAKLKALALSLVAYAAVGVAALETMHVTLGSVLLFLGLLAIPSAFCLVQGARNLEHRREILRLLCRRDAPDDNLPDYHLIRHLATVELWEAVVMLLNGNPRRFPGAKHGEGGLYSEVAGERTDVLIKYLKVAESHVDSGSLPTVGKPLLVDGRKLTSEVSLKVFCKWAKRNRRDLPAVSLLLAEAAALSP